MAPDRTTRPFLVGSALLVAALLPAPAAAQPAPAAACDAAANERLGTGVVWRGAETLRVDEIARLTAPVLWFSPDEPLLDTGYPPIPTSHPCDAPAAGPVVYYQVTRLVLRGAATVRQPPEDDPGFFDKVDRFVLKFFFYYPEDIGAGGHVHDLESAEFEVVLEQDGGQRAVRIARVEGLAHGSRWYSNTLEVKPDTKFPITILVEEGKHASSPDRNADGYFMRGYDVTERLNDAWGIRDTLGQGVLLSAGYNAEMTKRRTPADRLLPPEEPRVCVSPRRSSLANPSESLGRYELRAASHVPACEVAANGAFLTEMMDYHGFGEESQPSQNALGYRLSTAALPDRWLSLSLRGASRHLGVAMVFKGLDLREGWIVPRLTANEKEATADLMFAPSASRWAGMYLAGGARRQYRPDTVERTVTTDSGEQTVTFVKPPNWGVSIEAGIKLRAEIPRKIRPFVLGYSFGGLRFGVQALGWSRIEDLQFIWEIGAGAW